MDVIPVAGRTVRLVTHAPATGKMLCNGSIVVQNLPVCHDAQLTIRSAGQFTSGSDVFVIRPVPRSWGGQPGEYNIISTGRRIGCPRFLSASPNCNDPLVTLVGRDDGSGL